MSGLPHLPPDHPWIIPIRTIPMMVQRRFRRPKHDQCTEMAAVCEIHQPAGSEKLGKLSEWGFSGLAGSDKLHVLAMEGQWLVTKPASASGCCS